MAPMSPLAAPGPVFVRGSMQFDMPSEISGRTYRVFVFKPSAPPPPSGYPVVLVTDANLTFPIAATVAATSAFAGAPALIVGVGYPTDDDVQPFLLRNRDLTPPTPLSGVRQSPLLPPARLEDYGGSEQFFRFLVEELRPVIADAYSVNDADQTLYGHSIAGLFTLNVLFHHPESFRNFVASSPSIWWNGRALLNDEPDFVARLVSGDVAPRVLIMVGDREQDLPDTSVPGMTRSELESVLNESRMVDNARELAARLWQVPGPQGFVVRFDAIEDEDHMTVLPASISRAIAFALRPTCPD